MGAFPVTIPSTPQGYDIEESVRGHFGGNYNGAHYFFGYQGGLDSPSGDGAIHAMKSMDGVTWVEQDATHAPVPPSASGFGSAYTVSAPDGTTIWLIIMNPASSSVITSFDVQSYDLATDTWNTAGGTYTTPALAFFGGSILANSICVMDVIIRGTGDYVFQFNGATETVSGSQYGRVYVASFDGTTFGTPVMVPGQTGIARSFTSTRGSLDAAGITHFYLMDWLGSGLQNVIHVGMNSGAVGSFGSVSTLTVNYNGFGDPGYIAEPSVDAGVLSIGMMVQDPATSNLAYSFFSATAALNPTWTADPGNIITEDPTLIETTGANIVFDLNMGIAYFGGTYYFSFLVSQEIRRRYQDGAMYLSTSMDGGVTWSTPTLLWSAPVIGTSSLTAGSQQMLTYSFAGGIAILGMFITNDTQAEIAQFYAIGQQPVIRRRPLLQYRRPFHSGVIKSQ